MNLKLLFLTALSLLLALTAFAGEDLPPTLLTTRGKLLVSEDFSQPLAPFTGQPIGFATGFSGWRRNGGDWFVTNGTYKAVELAENHHPATASYGLEFKNAIIQCDVRLDDVPANGRRYRALFVKATDTKDYVCGLTVGQGGLSLAAFGWQESHGQQSAHRRGKTRHPDFRRHGRQLPPLPRLGGLAQSRLAASQAGAGSGDSVGG